jgi:hypothetical protein
MSSQVYSTERFTPNVLSKNVARHETTGELSTVPTAELGYDGELIVIDNIQELKAEAAEASSKSESVTHNHQVSDDISSVVNNIIRTSIKSTKSVDPRPQRSIAKRSFIKPKVVAIAVSVSQPGYSALLPSYSFNEQAQPKLKQALEEFNLGNRAKDKLKLVLLKRGHQDLIELKQEGPNPSAADTIMTFLKELTGYSAEEKIYVLKNLSKKRIKELKKILNAHNITLRAFIRA